MTTLEGNNGKTIHFAFNDTIHEVDRNTYIIEMPIVICSSKKDAEKVQQEVNIFISELSKKLLKK